MGTLAAAPHPGSLVVIRDQRWRVVRCDAYACASVLHVQGSGPGNAGASARFLLPFEQVEPVPAVDRPRRVSDATWKRTVRGILAAATPTFAALRTAAAARIDLFAYQLEPALAVTSGTACRLLIADDVGLGKTVQAGLVIAELLARHGNGRALIACPAGLRDQWRDELHTRFDLDVSLLDGTGLLRATADLDGQVNPWTMAPVIVTSIDFVKRPEVIRALEGQIWDAVVLDEAHNLSTQSDRATAAAELAARGRVVVLLTATPHSGDQHAFERLCSIGDRQHAFPLTIFRRTRFDAGVGERRMHWLRVRATPSEAAMHRRLRDYVERVWAEADAERAGARLAMTVLLRRAASSAMSLARSLERRLHWLERGTPPQRSQLALPFVVDDDDAPNQELAAAGLHDVAAERRAIERVLAAALAAAPADSKIGVLKRLLARTREPLLVFTEYRDTLTQLAHTLGEDSVLLHGGMTRSERRRSEQAFVHGTARLLLATDAASEGLNLHRRCRLVVNLELPWSPTRLEQRIGRIDRIGQPHRVHAIQLLGAGLGEQDRLLRFQQRVTTARMALAAASPADTVVAQALLSDDEIDAATVLEPGPTSQGGALSAMASSEADRCRLARTFRETATAEDSTRPRVVFARRPTWSGVGVEIPLIDDTGSAAWALLAGITFHRADACRGNDALPLWQALASNLPPELDDLGRIAISNVRETLRLPLRRLDAIEAEVRLRQGRIAAALLQPGLFDRHLDRLAGRRSNTLEDALDTCAARRQELRRLLTLAADPPLLRFARLRR